MAKKKDVTTEDLARMVQGGFNEINREFVVVRREMRSGFDDVNKRFDKLETRMDKLEMRMSKLETRMGDLESRMTNLETSMGILENKMDSMGETMSEVVDRVGRVEQIVDEDYHKRIDRLEQHVENLYERLAAVAVAKQ